MNSRSDLFRSIRYVAVGAALIVMLAMVGSFALARGQAVTLTLAKVTNPTGGQDFPITAVGNQPAIKTAFKSPRDIEQDQSGVLYIVGHLSSRVVEMDRDGTKVRAWGKKGTGSSELLLPQDLSLYEDENGVVVYVADSGNNRVQYFSKNGEFLGSIGSEGTGDGQFDRPEGVVLAPDRTLFVADTYNHRIQVFTPAGDFLRTWGEMGSGPGQFQYPASVALGAGGELYVADSNNNRIQVFTAEGQFLRQWGSQGDKPGQFNIPAHVHAGENGFIYVSDTYNYRVQKFTPEGRFIAMWGTRGTADGEFERPKGLVSDQETGFLYVVDIDNSRVDAFAETTVFLDDGEQMAVDLPPSTYAVTEAVESPWSLSDVSCDGGQPQQIDRGIQVNLADAVSCTFTNTSNVETGDLEAFVYEDVDQGGDYGVGDLPLQGWTVLVRDGSGIQVGNNKVTDIAGKATFDGLASGAYQVCQVLPASWFNSDPGDGGQPIIGTGQEVCQDVTVSPGGLATESFGNYQPFPPPLDFEVYLPVIIR